MSNVELWFAFLIVILFAVDVITWLRQNWLDRETAESMKTLYQKVDLHRNELIKVADVVSRGNLKRQKLQAQVTELENKLARIVSRLQSALDDKAE